MLGAGYWILDAGYWMLDAGYWMLDAGCWILDGHRIVNDRGWKAKTHGFGLTVHGRRFRAKAHGFRHTVHGGTAGTCYFDRHLRANKAK
jgi:hypothetical protein